MKKTVVYDYQTFVNQKYGGISRYFCELATRVNKTDKFSTKVLAPAYINQYLKSMESNLVTGISIPFIYKTVRLRNTINREISKLVLKRSCPDLVHETYYSSEEITPKKTKIVITIHDMIHEKFSNTFFANAPILQLKIKAISRADCIICVSENTRRDLLELFDIDPLKVFVTHLGCSLSPNLQKKKEPKENTRPYILYVGHRSAHKNFSRFLQSYAFSKNLRQDFCVVCFGGSPFSQAELDQFSSYNLMPNQIRYIEGDDTVLTSLYTNAAAFVYPSLYEGFGIPPLEAMACNCPVVCSDRGSIPEVVGDAAELFNPYNPESIIEALERVLYVSDRAQALICLGRERVKQFTWENCVKKTCAIYELLL
jgi:glycosyltransferase involved in cell wall biosynthesis